MQKMYRYFLMTVLAVLLSIPAFGAEATSIALIPLINNIQGDEIANQVFYKSAISAINAQKSFMLIENDKLTAAVDAAKISKTVPSEGTLKTIAKDGNADIVIAMQLDVLQDDFVYDTNQDMLKLDLRGTAVAYNKITGKYYKHEIKDDKEIPAALASRWDWTHEEWGFAVKAEVKRILEVKKVTLDAPRMSKL